MMLTIPSANSSASRYMSTKVDPSARLGLRIEQARWELPLPDGARRLIAAGDFDGRENETLVRWLASEPQLASRLLRWCNTPLFNLSKPHKSLEDAAKIMKGSELAQLAVLAWVRGLFSPEKQIDIYSRECLWGHSMAVASVGALIARTCTSIDPSMVFVAGALHDIGMVASERLDPNSFEEVLSQIDELSPAHEVEREVLGWDHTQLGAAMLRGWGMPDEVCLAAEYHHAAHRCLESEHAETVCCISIANYLCSRAGWSSVGKHAIASPKERVFQHLGIDTGLLTVLWQQLYSSLDCVSRLR
jgi:putative nucleotidyltransferase with HDIG domain